MEVEDWGAGEREEEDWVGVDWGEEDLGVGDLSMKSNLIFSADFAPCKTVSHRYTGHVTSRYINIHHLSHQLRYSVH